MWHFFNAQAQRCGGQTVLFYKQLWKNYSTYTRSKTWECYVMIQCHLCTSLNWVMFIISSLLGSSLWLIVRCIPKHSGLVQCSNLSTLEQGVDIVTFFFSFSALQCTGKDKSIQTRSWREQTWHKILRTETQELEKAWCWKLELPYIPDEKKKSG